MNTITLNQHNNWHTPDYFLDPLKARWNFNYDPCPYTELPITPETDGLLKEWGERSFVNPPYSLKEKEAFVKYGIEQSKKGKLAFFLLPVSTSTVLFHEHILPNITMPIEFLKKRLRFRGWDGNGKWVENKTGTKDSMLVIFDGRAK